MRYWDASALVPLCIEEATSATLRPLAGTSIGKQVRMMVGALATRVDKWRQAREGRSDWNETVRFSIYRDSPPEAEAALTYSTEALRRFNEGLSGFSDRELLEGRIG